MKKFAIITSHYFFSKVEQKVDETVYGEVKKKEVQTSAAIGEIWDLSSFSKESESSELVLWYENTIYYL